MSRLPLLLLNLLLLACDEGPAAPSSQTVCGNGYCETAGETYSNCPADCSRCGDGVCNAEESSANCAIDCSTPGCTSHTQCNFDQFCYQQKCQTVLGRAFRVTVESASAGTKKIDGSGWDFGGGAPGLSVQLGIVDGESCSTTTRQDTFSATWNEYCDFVLPSGGSFTASLWDIDTAEHDYIVGWIWESSDALVSLARSGGMPFTSQGARSSDRVTLRVTPRF